MPIEIKDIADFTGIESEDFDKFKEAFNEKYVPKETHAKTLGELNGKLSHEINKTAKEFGVDVESWKGKSTLEALPIFREGIKAKLAEMDGNKSATATELEAKFSGDVEKWKQKATDNGQLLETAKTELATLISTVETDKRQFKIDTHLDKAFAGLKFSDNANEYTRAGFKSAMLGKYKFDLTDEGAPIARDKTGNIVQSKGKAGVSATFDELLGFEIKEAKLESVVDTKKTTTFGAPTNPIAGVKTVEPKRFTPRFVQ